MTGESGCSARSVTRTSARSWRARTCCVHRRWAARASGWSSPRPSRPARRSSPRTSPATATSCATASTECSCPAAMRRRWPKSCATCGRSPSGARRWLATRPATSSASPGPTSPPRSWRPTGTRSRSRRRRTQSNAARSGSGCARPTSSRMCPLAACPAWSRSPPIAVTIPRWRWCAGSDSPRCRWEGSCSPSSRSTRSAWTTSPAP